MGKQFPELTEAHIRFVEKQHIFFTATAAPTGRVNVSPRPTNAFRVLQPNRAVYLDQTGSSNEVAAHLRLSDRMTIMFCAFEGTPMIVRLYGKARIIPRGVPEYQDLLQDRFANTEPAGARQMVSLEVDLVQNSCGMGVPLYDYRKDRSNLTAHWAKKTPEELETYQREKNRFSIDGFATGLFEDTDVS
ncbi:pyridoxamine 5'-phosphate oxidase family protein [Roseibium sp. RKSG952]|nr:pyridoxamine 5'-phosphate oxidase family protein [Roseibium sp. RKSG952]